LYKINTVHIVKMIIAFDYASIDSIFRRSM